MTMVSTNEGTWKKSVCTHTKVDHYSSLVGDGAVELEISAARPDRDARLARGDLPALRNDVPDGEVVARQLESHGLRLARAEVDGIEALEIERRRLG